MSFRPLFYENFDVASHASIGESPDRPPSAFSESGPRPRTEIEIARSECFEAGRRQGLAEGGRAALEEAEVQLAHDLPNLLAGLGGAAAAMARVKRACERDAMRLTHAALRQMLPILAERALGREAAALVAEVIANVPVPAIEVRAAQRTREAIERHGGPLPPGIALVVDPGVSEGSVRCTWAGGQARFDGTRFTEAVLSTLDRCLDGVERASPQLPDEHA